MRLFKSWIGAPAKPLPPHMPQVNVVSVPLQGRKTAHLRLCGLPEFCALLRQTMEARLCTDFCRRTIPSVYKLLYASKHDNFFIFRLILNRRTPRHASFSFLEIEKILSDWGLRVRRHIICYG